MTHSYPVWILVRMSKQVYKHTNLMLIVSLLQRLCIRWDLKAVQYISGSKFLGRIIISSFSWLQNIEGAGAGMCRCKHVWAQFVLKEGRPLVMIL